MKITLRKSELLLNDEIFKLELDEAKYSSFNKRAELYKDSKVSFINTFFFLFFIKRIYLLEDIIKQQKKDKFQIFDVSTDNILLLGILKKFSLKVTRNTNYYLLILLFLVKRGVIGFKFLGYIVASILYILISRKPKKKLDDKMQVAFINCKASLNKVKRYFSIKGEDIFYLIDDKNITPKSYNVNSYLSFYSIFPKWKFVLLVPGLIKLSYAEYFRIKKELKIEFNKYCSIDILNYCISRIFQTVYIEYALEAWINKNQLNVETIFSGVRDERFSTIQQNLGRKYKIHTVCIPHGLAYSINYPKGIFGDIFYTSSLNESKILEANFSDRGQSFIYDKDLVNQLYDVNYSEEKEKEIVFFTDARNIPLDDEIINYLFDLFSSVRVKLHPLDKVTNYSKLKEADLIHNFSEAITNNIVVSRNSTVLLEAVYNKSESFSILLNKNDIFNSNFLYPSLSHQAINKAYSLEELKESINQNL